MNEAEWQTRKNRIDKRLRSIDPGWTIIRYRDGLDLSTLTCHAVGFTPEQMQWLSLIQEHLIKNLTIDEEDFDLPGLLSSRGGKAKARKVFSNQLPTVIATLNTVIAT
jgi:hypothetical protein